MPWTARLVLPKDTVLDGAYRIVRVLGSGGFGITYEAEDINLATAVAIKEYYPFDFGDRDATMSVRPKSERHKTDVRLGPLQLPAGSAHAGALRPSEHRARRAACSRPIPPPTW